MQNLTREEIESIGLPKWPQLVIVGEKVTREQAYEIIIRTDGLYFSCNDRAWTHFCRTAFGMPQEESHRTHPDETSNQRIARLHEQWDAEDKVRKAFKILNLSYLNNSRIATAYVGGPKGWVDWDGTIGCRSFNIGKWPSTGHVFDEWERIAKAWPFLSLRSQLFDKEHGEEGGVPVIEYLVREGRVTAHQPEASLFEHAPEGATFPDLETAVYNIAHNAHRERGCSPLVLKQAVEHTLEVVSKLPNELEDGQEQV